MKWPHRLSVLVAEVIVLALMTAAPAFAETMLVCDLEPNELLVQDSPTILTLNESEHTISGKLGSYHYSDPTFQGVIREESFAPVSATFAEDEISFTAPPALIVHASAGDRFNLNRVTGEFQHFDAGGTRVGDTQRCHPATKQF
jgi:hypothetical protein